MYAPKAISCSRFLVVACATVILVVFQDEQQDNLQAQFGSGWDDADGGGN